MNFIIHILVQHIGMALVFFVLGLAMLPFLLLIWIAVILWCLVDGWDEISNKSVKADVHERTENETTK